SETPCWKSRAWHTMSVTAAPQNTDPGDHPAVIGPRSDDFEMHPRLRSSIKREMTAVTADIPALRTLVSAAQAGSRTAADRLVREHDGWVRGVIYGVTGRPDLVEDIAQQVWAQVWERLPSLKEPERLRSWLYSVARNAAIDAGQSRKRRMAQGLDGVA